LQFTIPSFFQVEYLSGLILKLIEKNNHSHNGRIRLTIFSGDGGLYDEVDTYLNFIIQSWPGNNDSNLVNRSGLVLNFFNNAKKSCDNFSHIKSNNFLTYVMGVLFAKKNNLNDCLIYNCYNRICESTIANVFIVSGGVIKTPALSEGCINGVMRRYLIDCFRKEGFTCIEGEVLPEELLQASEVFLTNAIYGMRWVKSVGESNYTNKMFCSLHQKFVAPLFT
jgi:branched-chain amino acid aminotransferase